MDKLGIPEEQYATFTEQVCHTCDNTKCVNPAHLYAGDSVTNAADRLVKGNYTSTQRKFTEDQVKEIKYLRNTLGRTLSSIAAKFNCGTSTVHRISREEVYRDVQMES